MSELNAYLEENNVPIKVVNCAPIFRFVPREIKGFFIPFDVDLFFHHMNYHGVYIWEGCVCMCNLEVKTREELIWTRARLIEPEMF
ncbi:hypothetical protein [Candidatus Uabimicrobium sp. HlEnr_7]|uniref:hypothetical protein n=1 Tax=Candidatus Uabimicrobium helgolandensis TaxID=3095367 RepID=UPI003558AEF0